MPFLATNENKGIRCAPRFYSRVGREDDNNPQCYGLQLRLINAAREGKLGEMRDALHDGANAEGAVYDYFPPLHTAASYGQVDAVRLVLVNGARVNRVTDFENTPLNLAAGNGHLDVVRFLLERGADVCYKSSVGTAGDIARARGHKEIADLLKASETSKCK